MSHRKYRHVMSASVSAVAILGAAPAIAQSIEAGSTQRESEVNLTQQGAAIAPLATIPKRPPVFAGGGGSINSDYPFENANRPCGSLVDGEATCSSDEAPFDDGIEYAERGDILLRLEDGLVIAPSPGRGGIIAYSHLGQEGSIVIDGAGASIDVQDASGVSAVASGSVTVDLASVTSTTVKEGELAWGIEAVSQVGDVRVNVGSVDVSGAQSSGIRTQNSLGDIAINAGSVTASGPEATAIFAMNSVGDIAINAETVGTSGDYAPAIVALNDLGWTNINVGALSTNGFSSDGIYTEGAGAVSIRVDTFETSGDYNWGANVVSLSASISPDDYAAYGSVHADFGKITLNGTNNIGVNYLGYGAVNIAVGQFQADGSSNSIAKIDAFNSVRVDVGSAVLRGDSNTGILASSQIGRVDVIVGTLDVAGGGIGALSGAGDVTVTAGAIRTNGYGGSAIVAATEGGRSVLINAGNISTDGAYARGIRGEALNGTVQISVDNVSTLGAASDGVVARGARSVVFARGDVTTEGAGANGLLVAGFEDEAFVQAHGNVSTSGHFAQGIWVNGRRGTATVLSRGEVTTAGNGSAGIRAEGRASNALVDVATVQTSGAQSHGIMARTQHAGPRPLEAGFNEPALSGWGASAMALNKMMPTAQVVPGGHGEVGAAAGDIDIRAGLITVTGEGSHGISARGLGAARILVRDVSSVAGQAIETDMIGSVDIDLRGNASSRNSAAIVAKGADVSLLIGASAKVVGGTDGIVIDAIGSRCITPLPDEPLDICPNPGDPEPFDFAAPAAANVGGSALLVNYGTIEAGTGYAVRADAGTVDVQNFGQIRGAIRFAEGDDLFDNRGLFAASGNSDFGGGVDKFRNSGTVRVATGSVRLDGLDQFENEGLIDLGNDRVGDVLTLAGDYIGRGNAVVRLDIDGAGRLSDSLVIEGSVAGSTGIALAGNATEARLTNGEGVVLIRVLGDADETAFTLDENTSDIGLVRYSVTHDAAEGTYRLVGRAGAGTYRLLGALQAVDTVTNAGADLWRAQTLSRRDALLAGGDDAVVPRLWGSLQGGRVSRDWSSRDSEESIDLSHRQTRFGGQIGYDLLGARADGARWRFGVTGGYTGSKLNYRGSSERADLSSASAGVYAAYVGDRLFANLLLKYDHHDLDIASSAFSAKQKLKGSSFGADGEIGVRFGGAGMFVEPTLGIAWTRSQLDDRTSGTISLDFESATNVRGRLGARFGGTSNFDSGDALTIYAGGHAVRSFGDDYALTVTSGASQRIEGGRLGTYGEGSLGIAYKTAAGFQAFADGQAEFGSGYEGLTGRVGFRIGF